MGREREMRGTSIGQRRSASSFDARDDALPTLGVNRRSGSASAGDQEMLSKDSTSLTHAGPVLGRSNSMPRACHGRGAKKG